MTEWTVLDEDGNKVQTFGISGQANARQHAFNALLAWRLKRGELCRPGKDGKLEGVCWIDVVEGTYRTIDPETQTEWRPILRKMTFLAEGEWVIMDAQLVSYENVAKFIEVQGIDPGDYYTTAPSLYWCRSVVDRDGQTYYEFWETQPPRSFGVWACRKLPGGGA